MAAVKASRAFSGVSAVAVRRKRLDWPTGWAVMPGTVIKAGAIVEYAIVGEDCVISENAHIGRSPEEYEGEARENWGIAVTGHRITVGKGMQVAPQQILSESI